MSIVTTIGDTAKKAFTSTKGIIGKAQTSLKSTPPAVIAAKGIGVLGAGAAIYDSNFLGKENSLRYRQDKDADAGCYYFKNTQYLNSRSGLANGFKNFMFQSELTNHVRGVVNSAIGYVSGVGQGLYNKIVPLGLSAAALLTKGKASIASGIALGAYGIYKVVTGGFSQPKE